jgi:hypothetical protein
MTHDQSFLGPSCSSVNIRVDTSNYLLVHMDTVSDASYIMQSALDIITEKQKYSFANLITYDAAYRCCHLSAQSTQESLTIHENNLYMAL